MDKKHWVVSVGEMYSDDKNVYEVVGVHFHWNTRNQYPSKKVIQFISYRTGNQYVLEQDEFLETRELFLKEPSKKIHYGVGT